MIRIKLVKLLLLVTLCLQATWSWAQINVTPNIVANALIDRLAGTGIVYSNATLTCPSNASGKFENGMASSVLMDSGIILTTGRVLSNATAYGVNGIGSNFASVNNVINGGDADLANAAGTNSNNIHDLCKLEFDFVPTGDTIQFRYRFGSEEYPEYNCSDFNDIFAFFISGPGYAVPTNVALVPGTNIPVSINSINDGTINAGNGGILSNCTGLGSGSPFISLYNNNSSSTTITYDGLTKILTAKASVTPCSTYHMKFAIADLTDHLYDSGVFLEAGSFSSDIASVISVTSSNVLATGTPYSMEGCNAAIITLARPQPKPYPQVVNYSLSGSATNGVDINMLSGSTTIPAFGTNATIVVTALQDGIIEGAETLIFAINGSLCSNAVTETLTMNILEYPAFIKPINDTICEGTSIPLSITPTPTNPDLTFSWSPSSSLNMNTGMNVIASPSISTLYTITSSYPGCPSVDSTFTITVDPTPTLSLTQTNILCNGVSNGSITALGNASLPMTLSINPGAMISNTSPFTFTNLGANTYTITLTSSAGCDTSQTATITIPNGLVWTNTQVANPICNGSTNGSILVSATGGSGGLSYTLAPAGTTNSTGSFTGLGAQAYTVTVSDANGCSISTLINLSPVSAITWGTISTTNVLPCFGNANGSINVNAIGGTGALTYVLNPTGATNLNGQFNGLNAANYTVQVSDVNGCSNATTLLITQPNVLQINSLNSNNISCNGASNGSISINVIGGTGSIQYTLMPGATQNISGVFSNLMAGNYSVIATDANGCSISTNINLTEPNAMQYTFFSINNVACNGGNTGSINAICSGGSGIINYLLLPIGTSNSTGTFVNLTAGNYTVQASDANGCSITSSAIITQQALIVLSTPIVTNVLCYGANNGSINVSASGGFGTLNYQLNPGALSNTSGIFSGLGPQNYTITVSDALGCTKSTTSSIIQPSLLQLSNVNSNNPTCVSSTNGSIQFSGFGGSPNYTFALNGGSFSSTNSFLNLGAGTYTIHLKDANACVKDSIISLVPLSNMLFNNINVQPILCKYDSTGSISLNTFGGISPYSYSLNTVSNGTNNNFINLIAGSYSVQVTDSLGCIKDTILAVIEPLSPVFFATISINDLQCYGYQNGQINAQATGGVGPYFYSLNGAPFQSNGLFVTLAGGNYSITVKDNNNCLHDTVVIVKEPLSPLVINLKKLKEITCIGLHDGEIHVGTSGGIKPYTYKVNGNPVGADSSFLNLSAGVYLIEVTDSSGCKATLAFTIAVPTNKPYVVLEKLIDNICKGELGGTIDWTGSNGFPPYTFTVNANFMDTVSILNNVASGNYYIALLDGKGCKADTTVTISNSTNLEVNVLTTPATCNGNGDDGKANALPSGGIAPYSFTWPGFTNSGSTLDAIANGEYLVIVTDASNCIDSTKFTIDYIPCCELYIPNAFSPNGDGLNDTYKLIPYGVINLKSFEIFDRWGKKIFYADQLIGEWDGKLQSVDYEIGTYYYLVQYYCPFSKELQIKKGDFVLLR